MKQTIKITECNITDREPDSELDEMLDSEYYPSCSDDSDDEESDLEDYNPKVKDNINWYNIKINIIKIKKVPETYTCQDCNLDVNKKSKNVHEKSFKHIVNKNNNRLSEDDPKRFTITIKESIKVQCQKCNKTISKSNFWKHKKNCNTK